MIKPKKLKIGSRIAIISPSNGLPFLFPDIYKLGLKNLQEIIGFEIVEMRTARMSPKELYNNPKLRAQDINAAFADDNIDGIITTIGGNESVRILKYLDTDIITSNPKFIMGFSDATTFLSYLNSLGMVTFYGPSVMAGFAQINYLSLSFTQHIKDILFNRKIPYKYTFYKEWTNGYKDWNNKNALGQCTQFNYNPGLVILQIGKKIQGRFWGGCMEILENLKSTPYWPGESFWDNRILFFETSEEKPSPKQVEHMLRNYGTQGILNRVSAVIFGRPKDYSLEEKNEVNEIILRVIRDECKNKDIPIIVNMDFGHTDPKIILPLGCLISIDPIAKEVILMESPFN